MLYQMMDIENCVCISWEHLTEHRSNTERLMLENHEVPLHRTRTTERYKFMVRTTYPSWLPNSLCITICYSILWIRVVTVTYVIKRLSKTFSGPCTFVWASSVLVSTLDVRDTTLQRRFKSKQHWSIVGANHPRRTAHDHSVSVWFTTEPYKRTELKPDSLSCLAQRLVRPKFSLHSKDC